jgi:hypothetical protein
MKLGTLSMGLTPEKVCHMLAVHILESSQRHLCDV